MFDGRDRIVDPALQQLPADLAKIGDRHRDGADWWVKIFQELIAFAADQRYVFGNSEAEIANRAERGDCHLVVMAEVVNRSD